MINKVTSLLSLLLLAGAPLLAQTEQLIIPLSSPGKPYSLDVRTFKGSIKVSGYTGADVVVDVNLKSIGSKPVPLPSKDSLNGMKRIPVKVAVSADVVVNGNSNSNINTNTNININTNTKSNDNRHSPSKDSSNGMKRIPASDRFELTAYENDNQISISSFLPNQIINLVLKIPQNVTLKLTTVGNGDITVENVKGQLEVNNTSGAIVLNNISGAVVATGVNKGITANFVSVDTRLPMAFSTMIGNIDITFPATIKNNIKVKTDRGEIYTDFNININNDQKIEKTTESGMYKVKMEPWVYGKINGGGPEIMMKNMQGNINIRKTR